MMLDSNRRFSARSKSKCAQVTFIFLFVTLAIGLAAWFIVISLLDVNNGTKFGYEDIFNSDYKPRYVNMKWDKTGQNRFYFFQQGDSSKLYKYDVLKQESDLFLDANNIIVDNVPLDYISSRYDISHNNKYVLLPIDVKVRWRHSFYANYIIYDIQNNSTKFLGNTRDNNPITLNAVWDSQGNRVAYVKHNNIYIFDVENNNVTIVTNDNADSGILNGILSWVYEEEIFSDYNGIWWSPDGTKIAYLKSNESNVPTYNYPYYVDITTSSYTDLIPLKYPKAGYPNPLVDVVEYNIATNTSTVIDVKINAEYYITGVSWIGEKIFFRTIDRLQHNEALHIYESGKDLISYPSRISDKWIESYSMDNILILDSNRAAKLSETQGYNHINSFWLSSGNHDETLTHGSYDVTEVCCYNNITNVIYYISAQDSPTERHLYAVSTTGDHDTNKLTEGEGYYSCSFDPTCTYVVLTNSGPDVPSQTLYKPSFEKLEKIAVLEDNQNLRDSIKKFDLPQKHFVELNVNGQTLNAFYMTPPHFSQTRNYALLLDVYGGPGSQKAIKTWSLGFDEYLASNFNIIIASIDGRGTGARGFDFMQSVYKQLGILETMDQVEGAKALIDLLPVSSKSVGIWGWSYGGFMTLSSLSRGSDVFKMGVSVAPVTDWHYYDSVYTERYMQTPKTNYEGYKNTSILNLAENFSTPLLLIHGTGDDNVHFQNSVELNNRFIETGFQYETMYYANRQHSIQAGKARQHLYKLITNFVKKNLIDNNNMIKSK